MQPERLVAYREPSPEHREEGRQRHLAFHREGGGVGFRRGRPWGRDLLRAGEELALPLELPRMAWDHRANLDQGMVMDREERGKRGFAGKERGLVSGGGQRGPLV